jgi:hypothetical protein
LNLIGRILGSVCHFYTGMMHAVAVIVSTEGPTALYQGMCVIVCDLFHDIHYCLLLFDWSQDCLHVCCRSSPRVHCSLHTTTCSKQVWLTVWFAINSFTELDIRQHLLLFFTRTQPPLPSAGQAGVSFENACISYTIVSTSYPLLQRAIWHVRQADSASLWHCQSTSMNVVNPFSPNSLVDSTQHRSGFRSRDSSMREHRLANSNVLVLDFDWFSHGSIACMCGVIDYEGTRHCFQRIIDVEGVRGLYKGTWCDVMWCDVMYVMEFHNSPTSYPLISSSLRRNRTVNTFSVFQAGFRLLSRQECRPCWPLHCTSIPWLLSRHTMLPDNVMKWDVMWFDVRGCSLVG